MSGPPSSAFPLAAAAGAAGAATTDPEVALLRALEALPGRSPDLQVCPFLRALRDGAPADQPVDEGALSAPVDHPVPENRCAAFRDPLALAAVQQELVCLVGSHTACPRYARRAADIRAGLIVGGRTGGRSALAVRLAGTAVVVAVLVALGFGLATGGFPAGASPGPSLLALASATASPFPTFQPTPPSTPQPTAELTLQPTETPGTTPTPPLTATPSPTPTSGPTSLAARWVGLPSCPAPQSCYLYRVRGGDTFWGIATYFGTDVAGLKALNPAHTSDTTIHVGEELKVPPPPG